MNDDRLKKIEQLIDKKKINEAQFELSKLGEEFNKNSNYLYLRGKIFYISELYYIALDTLLIALEFEKKDKIYDLIAVIYDILGNKELSKRIANSNSRFTSLLKLHVVFLISTSISLSANNGKRDLLFVGIKFTLFVSLNIATDNALQRSTSKPDHLPESLGEANPINSSDTPQFIKPLSLISSNVLALTPLNV